jgi:archaeal type IV pilus assembly protein PilA
MNYYMRKFKKNTKALSPVVASIILIAVTVAVSVVVAAWMGGMTIGLMGNAEQATITNIGFQTYGNGTQSLVVTVSNTGNAPITVTNAYINTIAIISSNPAMPNEILKESSENMELPIASYTSGTEYTVKLTTAEGNNLVLSAFAP